MSERQRTFIFFCLGLFLLPLPYLSTLLDSEAAILYRDLTNVQIPHKAFWIRAVSALWRVPQWNPLHYGGTPYLADPNYGPLYPLNVFLLLFSPENVARALLYFILLHHALLYSGAFLLLRELRVRAVVAAIGALALSWCGYAMSSDNLLNMLCAQAAVPFFFYFWRRSLRKDSLSIDLPLAALALAWPVYAGDPQFAYIAALGCLCFYFSARVPWKRFLARLVTLGALAFCAAAPQLLPTLTYLARSERNIEGLTPEFQMNWSLHPLRLLEAFFPFVFGSTPNPSQYWGQFLVNFQMPHPPFIFSLYLGGTAAVLGLSYGTACWSKLSRWRRSWPFLLGFVLLALLSLGIFSPVPVYRWFYQWLPLWRGFRFPERISFWPEFLWMLCAVLAAEKWSRLLAIRKRAWSLWPASATLALFALPFGLWVHHRGASLVPIALGLVSFGTATILLKLSRQAPSRWLPLLACLALTDLCLLAQHMVWPTPLSLMRQENLPLVRKLLKDIQARSGEIERGAASRAFIAEIKAQSRLGLGNTLLLPEMSVQAAESYGFLRGNIPLYWNIAVPVAYAALAPAEPLFSWEEASQEWIRRRLDLLAVHYFVLRNNQQELAVNVNVQALPHARVYRTAEFFSTATQVWQRLHAPLWKPENTVLLEKEGGAHPEGAAWRIDRLHQEWDSILLELTCTTAGKASWLLLNEAFNGNWEVHSPEVLIGPILRANGWAMGLALPEAPEGKKLTLTFRYREPSFTIGLYFFTLWCVALAIMAILSRRSAKD